MEHQTFLSYLGASIILLTYTLLLYVWNNAKKQLVPFVRYFLLIGICYIGTFKGQDFYNGVNLFDKYLIVHVFIASMIYFILIGFKFHNKITYAWRIEKLKNIFKWKGCNLSFSVLRQLVKFKKIKKLEEEAKKEKPWL